MNKQIKNSVRQLWAVSFNYRATSSRSASFICPISEIYYDHAIILQRIYGTSFRKCKLTCKADVPLNSYNKVYSRSGVLQQDRNGNIYTNTSLENIFYNEHTLTHGEGDWEFVLDKGASNSKYYTLTLDMEEGLYGNYNWNIVIELRPTKEYET